MKHLLSQYNDQTAIFLKKVTGKHTSALPYMEAKQAGPRNLTTVKYFQLQGYLITLGCANLLYGSAR